MGPLTYLLPTLPWAPLETIINIVAMLGVIMLIYGVFLEAERRQDAVFVIGSACLFVYAIWISSAVFAIAMGGFFIASAIELVEILLGRHHHAAAQVEKYKHPEKS